MSSASSISSVNNSRTNSLQTDSTSASKAQEDKKAKQGIFSRAVAWIVSFFSEKLANDIREKSFSAILKGFFSGEKISATNVKQLQETTEHRASHEKVRAALPTHKSNPNTEQATPQSKDTTMPPSSDSVQEYVLEEEPKIDPNLATPTKGAQDKFSVQTPATPDNFPGLATPAPGDLQKFGQPACKDENGKLALAPEQYQIVSLDFDDIDGSNATATTIQNSNFKQAIAHPTPNTKNRNGV